MASHIERTRFAQAHSIRGRAGRAVRIVMRTLSFALLIATIATFSSAQAQVIDFGDHPVGARINPDDSARGVSLLTAYLDSHPHAHSVTKVRRRISPGEEAFEAAPLLMRFTGPMRRVAFFAGNITGVTGAGTLKVFDANNALLAQDGPKPVPNNAFTAFFEARVPSRRIARAEFHIAGSAHVSIDDLVLEGTPGPLPTTPPVVAITSPTGGAVLAEGTILLQGTVTGPSLLEPITLRIWRGLPSDSTAPPSENEINLGGTGTTRTFSLNYPAIAGPYTMMAIAKNEGNLEGTATVHFTVPGCTLVDSVTMVSVSDGTAVSSTDIAAFDGRWMTPDMCKGWLEDAENSHKMRQHGWAPPERMMAMAHLFELTHDERYLIHLREFIELALRYRDDHYPGNPDPACRRCEPTPIDDFRHRHVAGWGGVHDGALSIPVCPAGGCSGISETLTGLYAYSIAAFARIVAEDPSLHAFYGADAVRYANAVLETMLALTFLQWDSQQV